MRNEAIREALAVGFGYFTVFVALSGCGKKDDGPVSMKGYASGVEAATEEETQAEESSLYTVSGVDTTLSTMTFLNIDTGRYEQYSYTDGTILKTDMAV